MKRFVNLKTLFVILVLSNCAKPMAQPVSVAQPMIPPPNPVTEPAKVFTERVFDGFTYYCVEPVEFMIYNIEIEEFRSDCMSCPGWEKGNDEETED